MQVSFAYFYLYLFSQPAIMVNNKIHFGKNQVKQKTSTKKIQNIGSSQAKQKVLQGIYVVLEKESEFWDRN